jgi:flagellar protein FliO/FliZ
VTEDLFSLRAFASMAVVLGLLALSVWALRRGSLTLPSMRSRSAIVVETATSLGERRSLAIVCVEGRRLVVGLTPGAVSLIAELAPAPSPTAVSGSHG